MVFLIVLAAAAGFAAAGEFRIVEPAELEEIVAEARDRPNATTSEDPESDVLVIDHRASATTHIVTLPGHPAHPSIMIKRTREAGGTLYIDTSGYTAAEPCTFQDWVGAYDVADTGLCTTAD